jgi:hypothetical protein
MEQAVFEASLSRLEVEEALVIPQKKESWLSQHTHLLFPKYPSILQLSVLSKFTLCGLKSGPGTVLKTFLGWSCV